MIRKLVNSQSPLVTFLLLCAIFLISRLINLTIIPIFGDEAIYLNWAQTIHESPRQLFIPLSDGKEPLFMWFSSVATLIVSHPLIAARLVSVVAGLCGMIGLYLVANELFDKKAGIVTAILYIATPIIFFYDRLALPDGLLSVLGIWTLYFAIKTAQKPILRNVLILGVVLGLGLLTKSPAIFYILLLPSLLLLHSAHYTGLLRPKQLQLLLYFAASGLIAVAVGSIMRLSKLYYVIGLRTPDFVFGPDHLLKRPLDPFLPRIPEVSGWLTAYLTLPILFIIFVGLFGAVIKKNRLALIPLLWCVVPLLLEMALAKGFTPRYFVFTIPPLLVIAGYGIGLLWQRYRRYSALFFVFCLVLILPSVYFNYLLAFAPSEAPIPAKEREGYIESWSAGWGVWEISRYLRALPQDQKILVGTEGHFGLLPDGLIAYLRQTPNIHVEGMGQPASIYSVPQPLIGWVTSNPNNKAFLVVNKSRMAVSDYSHLQTIVQYGKPPGPNEQEVLQFYEVVP